MTCTWGGATHGKRLSLRIRIVPGFYYLLHQGKAAPIPVLALNWRSDVHAADAWKSQIAVYRRALAAIWSWVETH
jgi:hypothetical protein